MKFHHSKLAIVSCATLAFASFASGATLGTWGSVASAQTTLAPVSLSGCHVTHSKGSANAVFHVQYMNNGKTAVDEIRFTTDFGSGNKPRTFTDKGTFVQGTPIMRAFNLASHSHVGIPSKPECTLQYVHFSNGTSWHAPSV
jgi:hypothetical protein